MTPLGHYLTPQHFTYFRKRSKSRAKQWCNWLSSQATHPWMPSATSTPGPAFKRQEASSGPPSHVSLHNIIISKSSFSLFHEKQWCNWSRRLCGHTTPLLAATSTPGPAAQVVPPSQPAQGHTSAFRLPLMCGKSICPGESYDISLVEKCCNNQLSNLLSQDSIHISKAQDDISTLRLLR